jgi:hypothetical protein
MRPERVRSEFREVELRETAILFLEFIFHLLIMRCLFQLKMQHLAYFRQICRKGEREKEEYRLSVKLLRTD